MSLLFWRKTHDTAIAGDTPSQAVTEDTPLPVRLYPGGDDEAQSVEIANGFMPPVSGQTILREYEIPGIGTGSAYADGEAFGTAFTLHDLFRAEKCSGTIVGAYLHDLDDEGLRVDVPLFVHPIASTTDNNAFAPSDAELVTCRAVVPITEFFNWSSNQFGQATNLGIWIKAESPNLYTQLVIRGAANIAAGAIPRLGIIVVPD